MKKLLYFGLTNLDNTSDGVSKKVLMQCNAFRNNGYEVYCAAYGDDGCYIYEKDKRSKIGEFNNLIPSRMTLEKSVIKYLKNVSFDICYIRYPYSDFKFIKMLSLLKKQNTQVYIEIPSYPNPYPEFEIRSIYKRPLYWLDRILVKKLSQYTTKIVTIGSSVDSIYNIPAINIPNGVNVNDYDPHNLNINDSEINIICIASMYVYHGYDRLIKGLINYYASGNCLKKIHLHFVGDGPEEEQYQNMCIEGNIASYVTFHGRLYGESLDRIYNKCSIACGTLGFHRENFTLASPLKTKEYFARGIPFIYAYEEIGLPEDYSFTLKLPANDDPIDIGKVIEFYNSYRDNYSEATNSMRNFAKVNYSWENILKFI